MPIVRKHTLFNDKIIELKKIVENILVSHLNLSNMAATTEISPNSILTLEEFPDEILFKVLDYLNIDDLFICTHVSRRISEICNDLQLWHKKIIGKFVKNYNNYSYLLFQSEF